MTDESKLDADFFTSAGNLVGAQLARMQADAPGAYAAVNQALCCGASLELRARFGVGGVIGCELLLCHEGSDVQVRLFTLDAGVTLQ